MTRNTDSSPHARSKRPKSPIAGPYGHPFHPLMVTIPIGTWVASLIFDIAALTSDEPHTFVRGAVWLIGIGIIGAIVAALLGFMDFLTLERGTRAYQMALTHMLINVVVLVLFIVNWFIRLDDDYEALSIIGFVLSIVALLALSVSGWIGGMLAYHFGVRVADEGTQRADGFQNR